MELTKAQCRQLTGKGAPTVAQLVIYLGIAALSTAIYKIATSTRGSIKIFGYTLTWGS